MKYREKIGQIDSKDVFFRTANAKHKALAKQLMSQLCKDHCWGERTYRYIREMFIECEGLFLREQLIKELYEHYHPCREHPDN